MPVTTGDLVGGILNAPEGSVTMQPNVSLSQAAVLSCFDFQGKRNKIVSTGMNFPSVLYVLGEQQRRGARLDLVPSEDGIVVDQERLLEAIDHETLLVCVSHVLFRSSFIQDVPAIVGKANEVGAKVVLDVYQSGGCVPVDLTGWNVDFAVGGCLKWLCGGPGAAFLYARPDLARDLRPMNTGWQAHARPFDFEAERMDWGDPSFRFLHGTPAIPVFYAVQEGLRIVREVGIPRIREASLRLTGLVLEEARAAGIPVTCPPESERRGGTVTLNPHRAKEVSDELIRRRILVDYRPQAGIRIGPHFYSTEDECRRVVSEIKAIQEELS